MIVRIIKRTESDNQTRYKVQYKPFKLFPFWKTFYDEHDYMGYITLYEWWGTKEEALTAFNERKNKKETPVEKPTDEVIQIFEC